MVENPIQHHPNPCPVQSGADGGKILVVSESAVQPGEIPGIIAVTVGFKDRAEIDGIGVKERMWGIQSIILADSGNLHAVVFLRCTAEAQRIDLIEYTFICPHIRKSFQRDDSVNRLSPRLQNMNPNVQDREREKPPAGHSLVPQVVFQVRIKYTEFKSAKYRSDRDVRLPSAAPDTAGYIRWPSVPS